MAAGLVSRPFSYRITDFSPTEGSLVCKFSRRRLRGQWSAL